MRKAYNINMQMENKKAEKFEYRIKKSKRAKCLRLTVNSRAELVVTVPRLVPLFLVNKFIREKQSWIAKSIDAMKMRMRAKREAMADYGNYPESKEAARKLVTERVNYFADKYDFSFNRIAIRNQSSRWGSCSAKRNLNFNYRLLFIKPTLADYVIVHELCHLREMNHSRNFWREVENIVPDWRERRRELKKVNL